MDTNKDRGIITIEISGKEYILKFGLLALKKLTGTNSLEAVLANPIAFLFDYSWYALQARKSANKLPATFTRDKWEELLDDLDDDQLSELVETSFSSVRDLGNLIMAGAQKVNPASDQEPMTKEEANALAMKAS